MVKKKERLNRAAFNRFFSAGNRHHTPSLQLIYSPHDTFHVSVVVPKKIERSAVKRNKLRRRIYDIMRTYIRKFPTTGVYIIVAKKPATTHTFEELRETVVGLVGRATKSR